MSDDSLNISVLDIVQEKLRTIVIIVWFFFNKRVPKLLTALLLVHVINIESVSHKRCSYFS